MLSTPCCQPSACSGAISCRQRTVIAAIVLLTVSVAAPRLAQAASETVPRSTWDVETEAPYGGPVARALEGVTALWFLAVGAAVGSFLNVVVYRMPAGKNLSRPKSSCPYCGSSIRFHDNIPVIGWLRLRGQCRDCRVAISPRYPFVEALTGLLFLTLLFVELFSGGTNLPLFEPYNTYDNPVVWIIWSMRWNLIGTYFYHCFLLAVMLAAILMTFDGKAIPRRLQMAACVVAVGAASVWPTLHPVPVWHPLPESLSALHAGGVRTVLGRIDAGTLIFGTLSPLCGALVGRGLGWALRLAAGRTGRTLADNDNIAALLMLVGLFLGWQAVVGVALASALAWCTVGAVLHRVGGYLGRSPKSVLLGVVVLVQILAWKSLTHTAWWPAYDGWQVLPTASVPGSMLAAACVALAATACCRLTYANTPGHISGERVAAARPLTASVTRDTQRTT